ncbi:MAG: transposase, partial [Planctomycetes bacterium]|nr:transposase [Planctomycetota bacterium]
MKTRQAGHRISDNAGALLLGEIDHRLAITADLAAEPADPCRPDRIRYQRVELLRRHLYGLAGGMLFHQLAAVFVGALRSLRRHRRRRSPAGRYGSQKSLRRTLPSRVARMNCSTLL